MPARRGKEFQPSEDRRIVQLRQLRWTYAEISAAMPDRSAKSLESRYRRLKREGKIAGIKATLAIAETFA